MDLKDLNDCSEILYPIINHNFLLQHKQLNLGNLFIEITYIYLFAQQSFVGAHVFETKCTVRRIKLTLRSDLMRDVGVAGLITV